MELLGEAEASWLGGLLLILIEEAPAGENRPLGKECRGHDERLPEQSSALTLGAGAAVPLFLERTLVAPASSALDAFRHGLVGFRLRTVCGRRKKIFWLGRIIPQLTLLSSNVYLHKIKSGPYFYEPLEAVCTAIYFCLRLIRIAPAISAVAEHVHAIQIPQLSATSPLTTSPTAPPMCGAIAQKDTILARSCDGIRFCK